MKRFLTSVVTAIALFVAPMADARQLYVRSDGADANAGTANTAGGAWRTLTPANAQAIAGDTINVVSFNVADTSSSTLNKIEPLHNGTSYANGIVYRSLGTAAATPVPSIDIYRKYIRVTRFRAKDGVSINTVPRGDRTKDGFNSVVDSSIVRTECYMCGVSNSKISNSDISVNTGTGSKISIGCDYPRSADYNIADTLMNNTVALGSMNPGQQSRGIWFRGYLQQLYHKNNKYTGTMALNGGSPSIESSAITFYLVRGMLSQDNKYSITITDGSATTWKPFWIRSACQFSTWHRDSLYVNGTPTSYSILSTHNVPPCSDDGPIPPGYVCDRNSLGNTFRSCVFDVGNGSLAFQNTLDIGEVDSCSFKAIGQPALYVESFVNGTIKYSKFASQTNAALVVKSFGDDADMHHNFFYGRSPNSNGTGVVQLITIVSGTWASGAQTRFHSNAVYSNVGSTALRSGAQWRFMTLSQASGQLDSDYNLYGVWGVPDRAVSYTIWPYTTSPVNGVSMPSPTFSAVGPNTTWDNLNPDELDTHSRWLGTALNGAHGPIGIADTTFAAFNPTPQAGSALIGGGEYGSDIGPITFGAGDVIRPAPIVDLQLISTGQSGAELFFTSVGDDSLTLVAHHYQVRISTSIINEANFDAASPVDYSVGTPRAPGSYESMSILGLNPETLYYVAIKAVDEVLHRGAISNVVAFGTQPLEGGEGFDLP